MAEASEGHANPAVLLAAANSFVAETAVKLDRLEGRATVLETGLRDSNVEMAQAFSSLRESVSQIRASADGFRRDLDEWSWNLSSRLTKVEEKDASLVTSDVLASAIRQTDDRSLQRQEPIRKSIDGCEEDYERLRLRLDSIEKIVKPKRDHPWSFGAGMFSLGVISAVLILRFPL